MKNRMKQFFNPKKLSLLAFAFMGMMQSAMAQTGVDGLNAADQEIRSYIDPITNITLAIGIIVGLIGAIKVYIAWNSGEQATTKMVIGWFGACLFLVLSSLIVQSFFA